MRDLDGKFLPSWKGVECIAHHLKRKHLSNNSASPITRSKRYKSVKITLTSFDFSSKSFDIRPLKNNIQPTPDGLICGAIQMDEQNDKELIVGFKQMVVAASCA